MLINAWAKTGARFASPIRMIYMRQSASLTVKRSTVAKSKCQSPKMVIAAAAVADARVHAHAVDAAHDRALAPDRDRAHDPAREAVAEAVDVIHVRARAHDREIALSILRNMLNIKDYNGMTGRIACTFYDASV